jgi:hypothetical protein
MTTVTRRRDAWTHSPQQVDPFSWFTGPQVPLILGAASTAQAIATIVFFWDKWSSPLLQIAAVPFFVVAALTTAAATRADRPGLRRGTGAVVLLIAVGGLGVSAAGTLHIETAVELWWAPTAVGLVLGSFAPFISARRVIGYAIPASLTVGVIVVGALVSGDWVGDPVESVAIALTPIAIGAIGAVVFSVTLVGRTRRLLAAMPEVAEVDEREHEHEHEHDRVPQGRLPDRRPPSATIARVTAQTVPFLQAIADAGVVTDADRTLAAHLARQLRAELVSTASRSWLDVLAQGTALVVSDPARVADRMNDDQRAALRGLLQDMLGNAVVDRESLLIELRADPDGSTAVALSLEVDLPEGRRVVMLAPYYLTLKNAVENLSWRDGRSVMFTFQIPPASRP